VGIRERIAGQAILFILIIYIILDNRNNNNAWATID
jgi:hypothetical protein